MKANSLDYIYIIHSLPTIISHSTKEVSITCGTCVTVGSIESFVRIVSRVWTGLWCNRTTETVMSYWTDNLCTRITSLRAVISVRGVRNIRSEKSNA